VAAAAAEHPEPPEPSAALLEPAMWPEPPLPETSEGTAAPLEPAMTPDPPLLPETSEGTAAALGSAMWSDPPLPEASGEATAPSEAAENPEPRQTLLSPASGAVAGAAAAVPAAMAAARGGAGTVAKAGDGVDRDGGDNTGAHREEGQHRREPAPEQRHEEPPQAVGEDAVRSGDDADAGAADDDEGRRRRRPLIVLTGLAVIALLIAGGVYYWLLTRDIESTDDAYTDGRAVAIAPRVGGEVVALEVNDNQFVKEGQTLIRIDPRQYRNDRDQAEGALATAKGQHAAQKYAAQVARKNFPAQLEQSKAQVESAKAAVDKARADYERQMSLRRQATTGQEVDQALTALRQAEAQVRLYEAQVTQNSPVPQLISQSDAQVDQLRGQVEQAQARLDQADLNLSWTTVTAPQDGWITRRNVEKGNYVVAGQQIFSIVTPEVWVTANFKETQLTYMRPGQPVRIRIDAYPSLDVRGHVDSIQRGSGSKFTAFPPENATGNFVKIVQRVPVKIVIDSGISPDVPMPLGISVVPTVTVR